MGSYKYLLFLIRRRFGYSLLALSLLTFTSLLTGCDKMLPQEDLDFLDEMDVLYEKTPAVEVTNLHFSPDDKTFTVTTRMTRDIGPYQLANPKSVRIDVKETVNGIPQHRFLPVLTAARNTEADEMAATGIKAQVIIDLTLPQADIYRQQRAVADMLTCFSPENLYVSFIYGDSISTSIKASEYVMNNYFQRKNADHKYLYRAILQKKQEMEEEQAPWNGQAGKLLVVFSDEQVYLSDDLPMDPNHFDLQEQLLEPDSGSIEAFYVSLNKEPEHEDGSAVSILKMFCQKNKGLYLTEFNWLTIKNAMFTNYGVNIDSYEFSFVNPDFKIYRGNNHTLILDFYSVANDSLVASASALIHKGSIYEPVIVHGHSIGYVLLQGFLFGLILLAIVYLLFQYLVPFIRYHIFLRRHVITFTGPLMSARNRVVGQSCYLCKTPFQLGDRVVVKCSHTMHKACWDENEYHCPEYGPQCSEGSHFYNSHRLHDPRNATFYLPWILVAMAAAIVTWAAFLLWAHFSSTHVLEGVLRWMQLVPDSNAEYYINEYTEHEKHLPVFGLFISFFLTFGFATLAMFNRNGSRKLLSIFLRALLAGLSSMLCFFVIAAIEAIFDIDALSFLIEWIPWTLSAFIIAYFSTTGTRIHLKKRMLLLAALIALCSMYVWSFFILGMRLDFRVLLLCSHLVFAIGLAVCVAEPVTRSNRYVLRVSGSVKTMEVALYKWFAAAPNQIVTLGKSVDCSLQLSWDMKGDVAPVQAEISMDQNTPWLMALEPGVYMNDKPLEPEKKVRLYHGKTFYIGHTSFTYLEKDR